MNKIPTGRVEYSTEMTIISSPVTGVVVARGEGMMMYGL